jgi:predicted  nucleic acid-binding Zn-ribbon protein
MQERYEETMELSSSVNSVGERLDAMIKENEQRRKEMTRIETTQNQSKLGESVSSLNDIIAQLQDQIFDSNKSIAALAEEVAEVKTRN